MYEIFEQLLQENNVTPYKVAKEAGVTQTSLSNWKRGKSTPSRKTLQKIATYFNVSMDYLTTGKESVEKTYYDLTDKDEKDIAKRLESALDALDNTDGLMFSGEPLDDETRELLKASMENSIRIAKINAKKKFTPKKYRNTEE